MTEPLRLSWRRTRQDVPEDFSCSAPEADMMGIVGRIHFEYSPRMEPRWSWFCHATIGGCLSCALPYLGTAETKVDAARAVEAKWFEMLERATALGLRRLDPDKRNEWDEIVAHNARALEKSLSC